MNATKISACVVVYNEAKVIEKCLMSIKDLADEIIVVHDGACDDATVEIARKYTEKVFVRPHVGMMEGHLPFAFNTAKGEWLLRIDADEYFDASDIGKIRALVERTDVNGFVFRWEMWNGKPVYYKGLQKMCLYRKNAFHYLGIPHENGRVDGKVEKIDIVLHHRPSYDNVSWNSFLKKKKKWIPVHAQYFFPERLSIESFNANMVEWQKVAGSTREHLVLNIMWTPLKNFLGQIKNGVWTSWWGINSALQQYVYYFSLYLEVWKMTRSK